MSKLPKGIAAAIAIGLSIGATAAQAQQPPFKMTLFGQPSVNNDAIWMALEKGLYQQEGLDVTYRLFPSGTTAFQAFQTGQGDIAHPNILLVGKCGSMGKVCNNWMKRRQRQVG